MDSFDQQPVISSSETKIELTTDSINSLDTIWRWASFFSVLGFIMIAFLILLGIMMGFLFSALDNGTLGSGFKYVLVFIYIVMGAVYFLPVLYLFRFSNWTKKAIRNRNSLDLSVAFKNLKSHFQYVGIMTIVLIGIYILLIFGIIIFKAIGGF